MLRICAIAVTFSPDPHRLGAVLSALAPQVRQIFVVDNGSPNRAELIALLASVPNAGLLELGRNMGIGAALNRGVDAAHAANFDAVLLMDQDSIPSSTMVADLARGLWLLSSRGDEVAAIGPRFLDRHSGNLSRHVVFAGWRVGRVDCVRHDQPVVVDFLITSGSLITMEALRVVGPFNEDLFIDHIDTEWVLRAQVKGYRSYGDCTAVMEHDLGEFRRRIWLGRWREVPIHKPFRYYYIFRNSLWLRRQPYASPAWKRVDAMRLMQILGFMAFFHPQRWAVLKMVARGLRDGLIGRMGVRP
jgi:rhamnosyltransferase